MSQGIYHVDIVMCIDGTGSMVPFIETIKSNALSFHSTLEEELTLAGKTVAATRVKVIVFGDYKADANPMVESPFYVLPDENDAFSEFVNNIHVSGGGDIPENGYEAIATALKSDWTTEGIKRRHIIAVFSDAPALPLGERAGCPNYPTDIPTTMADLSAWWEGTDQTFGGTYSTAAGRLIAFVPNDESWSHIQAWNRSTTVNKVDGKYNDMDMSEVYAAIVGSFVGAEEEQ